MEEKEIFVEEKEEIVNKVKKHSRLMVITSGLTSILYLVSIIAYLLIGFLTGVWHPTWVIFFAPIIISSLVLAIGKKNAKKFCYPVFVVAVYVLFGSLFTLWHPLWVLFITIPLYYSLISFVEKLKR